MKTTNNVQKANLKSAVAATTLMLAVVVSTSIFAAETKMNSLNAFLAEETEEPLEIEAWMTDANNFYATTNLEAEAEQALEIENWMKNDTLFETQKLAEVKKAYGSHYGENKFGRRAFIMIEKDEPKLKLEQWMLDYKYWNGK